MPLSVDMTPTPTGYCQMARLFRETILGDVKQARRSADTQIMKSLLEIAGYLAANHPNEFKALIGD